MNNFIKGNKALYRAIYLRILDKPPSNDVDFEQELHDLVRLEIIFSHKVTYNDEDILCQLPFVHRTVCRLVDNAFAVPQPAATQKNASLSTNDLTRQTRSQTSLPSRNADLLTAMFDANPWTRYNFLYGSFIFDRGRLMGLQGFATPPERRDDPEVIPAMNRFPVRARDLIEELPSPTYFQRARTGRTLRKPSVPREEFQLSAKLHCLYGWGLPSDNKIVSGDDLVEQRTEFAAGGAGNAYALACAKVYDLREYTFGSGWGPFLDEDTEARGTGGGDQDHDAMNALVDRKAMRVDWEKLEAIMIVLGTNIRVKGLESHPVFWNVWGKSFADYSDFFSFNAPFQQALPNHPRGPLIADQATRLIIMRIRTTKIEPPGPGDHPDYPVVHFEGISRPLDGLNNDVDSELRGLVRTTPEGEVRWTSYSVMDDIEMWKIADDMEEELTKEDDDSESEDELSTAVLDPFGLGIDWDEYEYDISQVLSAMHEYNPEGFVGKGEGIDALGEMDDEDGEDDDGDSFAEEELDEEDGESNVLLDLY
ncbi:hypothetical protein N0V88_003174 [Collariella sp. IMI 366227]|nr:hypothetical protein N0V88_003174 [Collariella sp. IMI 366227]